MGPSEFESESPTPQAGRIPSYPTVPYIMDIEIGYKIFNMNNLIKYIHAE